jgi:oxygen-independent coproporphyrinogen-3 oxidase
MSIELDPRETSSHQIETLAQLGFRSLSVGVQDFSPAVQDAIHRHQSRVETAWLIKHARACGFTDINCDIVYGLPHQNEESFTTTLAAIIDLAPDRIALFGYAHLPSKLPHQRLVERSGRVLDPYERATLLLLAIDKLTAAGYVHIGLDHFAKPGSPLARAHEEHRMVRTFQGYVPRTSDTVLGLGMSAISSTRRMFWQNQGELVPWESAIVGGHLPLHRGIALDKDDQLRRAVINDLMCDGTVELGPIATRFDISAPAYFARELAELTGMPDLAHYDASANAIRTTPMGKLLVRNVCMLFDRYARPVTAEAPRFSSTI